MKKAITGSLALIVYVNLVPYACRIWGGFDWVAQYLPDEARRVSGLLFFGGFASLVAIPLVVTFLLRKWIPVTFPVALLVATVLLSILHYDYDLASDAQAALGLIAIPVCTAVITGGVAVIVGIVEVVVRKGKGAAEKKRVTGNG